MGNSHGHRGRSAVLAGETVHQMQRVKMAPLGGVVYAVCRYLACRSEPVVLVVPGRKEGDEALHAARLFSGKGCARLFPHYELNPYESSSPDPGIAARRIETLFSVMSGECRLVIATGEGFSTVTAPPGRLREKKLRIAEGMMLTLDTLIRWLSDTGYQRIPEVSDAGDFSVRGGIVDIYSPGVDFPVRVEFLGDQVESIRFFHPTSQRTIRKGKEVTVYPASEIVWDFQEGVSLRTPEHDRARNFRITGERFAGMVYHLPRIYGERGHLLHYFDDDPHIIVYDQLEVGRRQEFLLELAHEIYEKEGGDAPPPEELFLGQDATDKLLKGYRHTSMDNFPGEEREDKLFGIDLAPVTGVLSPHPSPLTLAGASALLTKAEQEELTIIVTVPSPYRLDVVKKLLEERGHYPRTAMGEGEDGRNPMNLGPGIFLLISGMRSGFISRKGAILLVTDYEIFGSRAFSGKITPLDPIKGEKAGKSFKKHDYVVHEHYGIGQFGGIKGMRVGEMYSDFGIIHYDGGDTLYLPVYRMDLIQKYQGGEGAGPKLDRLGSRRWERTKKRVKEKVQQVAAELLSVHAAREIAEGFPFDGPDATFEEFAGGFEFEETPDQEEAIKDVIANMTSGTPMDRLVCGDVGYGKTEVALRAAFLAVMSGKQVALLCPTTVLSQQHFRTFRTRFERFPVRVAVLSRFVGGSEQKEVVSLTREGQVDILIGTHRLLQRDVAFRDLGLLIIDEEQKFGVMHKEKLKKIRSEVDVLTLSATPIPRTLHIALSGIKDISIIQTPPKERLSVKTFVVNFSEEIIREGIGRELRRGGQVYYIHNRIQTITKVEQFLRELVPHARIEVAHGQMGEEELDGVMKRFYQGAVDVLLCTAIVESGLDIPRANTMIVDRSHTFGLAQLYQLRGRIGRDRRRAYAYLVVPPRKSLTPEAVARLTAIEELSELGSGFQIASYDLDIRGGGDILGASQSGHIQHVGYEMYVRFLEEAVAELKGKRTPGRALSDVELNVSAYIPDEYMQHPQAKLDFYRKISMIRSEEDYREAWIELIDRYGEPPREVTNLLRISLLRCHLAELGVRELKGSRDRIHLSFEADSPVDRNHIARLAMKGNGEYGFDKKGAFFATTSFDGSNWDQLSSELRHIFGSFGDDG